MPSMLLALLCVTDPLSAKDVSTGACSISQNTARSKSTRDRKKQRIKNDSRSFKVKGLSAFISAATIGTETIDPDAYIKSFVTKSAVSIVYNKATGIFTSYAGPGHYEVIFGAHWTRFSRLALSVDGVQVNPFGNMNSQGDWATEAIIVHSTALSPTFAIGAALDPLKLDGGTDEQGCITAFVTIKKL